MKLRNKIAFFLMVTLAAPLAWVLAEASAASETVNGSGPQALPLERVSGADKAVARLKALRPEITIENVLPTPIPGIYALEVSGGVFHVTEDGNYLIQGKLFQLGDSEIIDLTDAARMPRRKALMDSVPLDDMVVFAPSGPTKAVLNVFTDVDCGFCQKFHQEVPQLNGMGIEVRYLAWPRGGMGTEGYSKLVTAWCSDDPHTAITKLKAREQLPAVSCPNPVAEQFELGLKLGISGTPSIIVGDGRIFPGYRPAEVLAEIVGI